MDYKAGVGRAIKKLRHDKGITQKELATNIGATSVGSIKAAEQGKALTLNKVDLIASELEVKPSYIYYIAEEIMFEEYKAIKKGGV